MYQDRRCASGGEEHPKSGLNKNCFEVYLGYPIHKRYARNVGP